MLIEKYGYKGNIDLAVGESAARVLAVHRERYEIVAGDELTHARLKGGAFLNGSVEAVFPTVGDYVAIEYNPAGDSVILRVLERSSLFSRMDPSYNRAEQAVAANFDYVFILTSLNQEFKAARLERYMTVAWQSGGLPVVLLTKADVAEDLDGVYAAAARVAVGAEIIPVSAVSGEGLSEVRALLAPGRTAVLLGSSGVGKSSLLNALDGEEIMKVNAIREDDSKGRHTTTHRQMVLMKSGAIIIDTPGMRELGMWSIEEGVKGMFGDIEQLSESCRYSNCAHESEPGCAVRAAMDSGALDIKRWNNYQSMLREARHAERKARVVASRRELSHNMKKAAVRQKKGFEYD